MKTYNHRPGMMWKLVEDHSPLCNPEIEQLRQEIQIVVGLSMWADAIRRFVPHAPQPDSGYCFQAYLAESTDINDIPAHSWDIEVLPEQGSYLYRGQTTFDENTYHVWWGGEEVGFVAQLAR